MEDDKELDGRDSDKRADSASYERAATLASIHDRITRILRADVSPFFRWLPSPPTPKFELGMPIFSRRSRWRILPWWPSDNRSAVQQSLLRLLAAAHRERLELAPLIKNLADEHRGLRRLRLLRLAKRLAAGTTLIDAIEQTPNVLSEQDILALRFATQSGVLTQAYPALLNDLKTDQQIVNTALRRVIAYSLAMLLVISVITCFQFTFIVPKMRQIMNDGGVAMPWAMTSQVDSSEFLSKFAWLWVLLGIVVVTSMLSRRVRRRLRLTFGFWLPQFGLSYQPADLLRLLSLATAAGRPISSSLSTLARYHFDSTIRRKLLFVRNEVEQGADAWTCLRDNKLITGKEAEAIVHCPDAKSQAWLLSQLANVKAMAATLRLQILAAWLQPIVVLCFGAIVFWLSIGHYQSLQAILFAIQGWTS